jgi:hypothetical protein
MGLGKGKREIERREVMEMLIESRTVGSEEIEIYRSSKYRVITIIPSKQNPAMNTYIFSQEDLDHFLKDYSKYAEFIISVSQVEAMA